MAYVSPKLKKSLVSLTKPVLAKWGVKGSFSVDNHSAIVLTVRSGPIDFWKEYLGKKTGDYIDVNLYHIESQFSGKSKDFLLAAKRHLNAGNHDRSDIQSDYFDVGWYTYIKIGNYKKPYILT